MCGRFVVARASSELAAELGVDECATTLPGPSFNVAPTTRIPLIVDTDDGRRLEAAKWGLVPSWAKDESVAVRAFNARSETAATKPTFRAAVKQRRGVIPADGYYEWHKRADGTKQPYFVHPTGPQAMLFAALYEWWRRPDAPDDVPDDEKWLLSATILTRSSATENLTWLHDRTPVLLAHADVTEWLDPQRRGDEALVREFADRSLDTAAELALHPVDRRVGNARVNDAGLIDPIELDS